MGNKVNKSLGKMGPTLVYVEKIGTSLLSEGLDKMYGTMEHHPDLFPGAVEWLDEMSEALSALTQKRAEHILSAVLSHENKFGQSTEVAGAAATSAN